MIALKPKVLFVYSDRYCSCTHKRCFEIVNGLWRYQKNAVEADAIEYLKLNKSHFEYYDIILFQRLGANGTLLEDSFKIQLEQWIHAHRNRCTFIYDIDDLLLNRQNQTPLWLAKLCDVVLVPNEELERQISPYQKCTIIRTHVNMELIRKTPKKNLQNDSFNVGWFSASANGFNLIKEVIHSIADACEKPVLFHLFCISHWHAAIQKVIDHPSLIIYPIVSEVEMYGYMKGMDVIINPLIGHQFYESELEVPAVGLENFMLAKSEIKYALAGACGVPLIVSPLGAYRINMQHDLTGYFATSPEEWKECLVDVFTNRSKAERISHDSHQDVAKRYSLERAASDYNKLFSEIKA